MFSGEYNHTIDEKGRITIPAKYRDTLAAGLVITRGFDHHLSIYTIPEWEIFSEKVTKRNKGIRKNRMLIRRLIGGHVEMKPDKQGRILIPDHLLDFADLEKEAVIVGVNNELEVWNTKEWKEMLTSIESDALVQELEELEDFEI